jgi:cysteine desulfurase
MNKIYLDHAATTPVDKQVLKAMLPYFSEKFGNPMALYSFGQEAMEAVEKARKQTADFLGAKPEEIIFTSGATESNNFAIKGVIKKYNESGFCAKTVPHIILSSIEHHSVLDTCKFLEKSGRAEITYLPVNKEGIVEISEVKKALKPNTILVSIMYVNNEIGTIQPIAEIGKLIKNINKKFEIQNSKFKILFHTDATQALNYFDCNVQKLGADLLSFSGHKIYGPKGTGALYIKKGTFIKRIQDGGDQEFGLRAGTHNVPGIVGLAEAIRQVQSSKFKVQNKRVLFLKDYLIEKVLKEIPEVKLNGLKKFRSPSNANFSFANVEGESLVLSLDREGIACSTGSACSTDSLEPSHVLSALGLRPKEAHSSLRVSLGKDTNRKEIDIFIKKLKKTVKKLRGVSGKILEEYRK